MRSGLVYLIGSLRNAKIPLVGNAIRELGYDVYDDWWAPGARADECWREYEIARGRTYLEALRGRHAADVFGMDKKYLDAADFAVMVCPAGRSAHLELGYVIGRGRPGYILLDDSDRFDIMYRFATGVFGDLQGLLAAIR